MKRLIGVALPFALMAGCHKAQKDSGAGGQDIAATRGAQDVAMPLPEVTSPVSTPAYLAKASAGDVYEIEMSKLILAKTRNDIIRRFARMMIEDHGKSTATLEAAAKNARLAVTKPALDEMQQNAIAHINDLDGKDADRAYLDAQQVAHREALDLHSAYAANGDVQQLKAAAAGIASVVQHHIDRLNAIRAD